MSDNESNEGGEDMAKKLKAAGKKVEKAKTERQARAVKGGHLNPVFLQMVTDAGLEQDEKSGFIKVTATGRTAKLYVAKKGGRVDLAFEFSAPGIKQITEEDAKARHLGKIRGQLDFEQTDETLTEAFGAALAFIAASPAANVRPPRPAKPAAEPEGILEGEDTEVTETPADEPEQAAG